jgi:hypothetical protein
MRQGALRFLEKVMMFWAVGKGELGRNRSVGLRKKLEDVP